MKQAVIIGASSGIGKELALVLSRNGYTVGLTGRRLELLEYLNKSLPTPGFVKKLDVADTERAMAILEALIGEMGAVELIAINAGTGFLNPNLDWEPEKKTIDVNVSGFAAMANVAYRYFAKIGRGHIVGVSSLAALRGGRAAPAYHASKAFVSNYLEGLRVRAFKSKLPIVVTDIKPGFVDTAMAQGSGLFWVAPVPKAAAQIYKAIQRKASHAYITKRWAIIGSLMRMLPFNLYSRL
jgi:short-subunit dehydrogenase